MTIRLVALMSVVLLLSLAAFGLVMTHYQDQVMQEVARTASDAGKAALRTLDFAEGPYAFPVRMPGGTAVFRGSASARFRTAAGDAGAKDPSDGEPSERPAAVGRSIIVARIDKDGEPVREIREWISVPHRIEVAGQQCTEIERIEKSGLEHLTEALGEGRTEVFGRFVIDLDEVQAVPAGHDTLMLTIPTFEPRPEGGPEGGNPDDAKWQVHMRTEGDTDDFVFAKKDEIRLPIEMADYRELYRKLRGRSLMLFFGVFLVGTVLSAGLASRFTRPIRKLDSGIRRLSDGDLDVEVAVAGKDEIARLGVAFNEMTYKLRESRDRSRDMLRREKLSALGGLAAGVAHDVRNPLHSIGLTLQHLHDAARPESPEKAEEFDRSVDIIRGEIRRLDRMVTNFLRFSRSERRERQPVDLAALLEETANLVRKEAEWRGIDVRVDALATAPAVWADGESIRSSLLNLVLNSFEAMPDGGSLTLTLRIEGDAVVVQVADTGRGIPEEDLDRVFEFAYTTREAGNGVGLATVHQCIVEEHGGDVSIDSRQGEGTRVRLALPIRPPRPEEKEQA